REKQQLLLEIKELKERLVVQQVKHSELYQQNQSTERSYLELQNKYNQSETLIESLKNKVQQLERTNIEYQQTSHHWQNQFKDSQGLFEAKLAEMIALQSDNKLLNQQLIDIKELLRNTQDQNKLLMSEKWELAQEKMF